MRVKTFTADTPEKVDKQVNEWLGKSKVKVVGTDTAIKEYKVPGKNLATGKRITRPAVLVAISVWYEEPPKQK